MYFLTVNHRCKANIFGESYHLEPISYPKVDLNNILVSDDSKGVELLARHRTVLLQAKFDANRIPGFPQAVQNSPSRLPANSKVIILRGGGIGDHIMLTPALRALKQLLSDDSEIWLVAEKANHYLFEGNPDISRLLSLPIRMSNLLEADYYIDFSFAQVSLYKELNLTDFYLHCFNIDHKKVKNKGPSISNGLTKSSNIRNIFDNIKAQNQGRPIVLLHWLTSTVIRDVPPGLLSALPLYFPDVLFVVAHKGKAARQTEEQIDKQGMKVMNLSMHMKSLRDYATAISCCDAIVSADTCAYHIAAALKKPALVLFGPVGSDLRIRYYKTVTALDANYFGETCKSPCGLDRIWKDDLKEHGRFKKKRGCSEAKAKGTEYSPCLLSITDERLAQKFRELIRLIINRE